MFRVPYDDNPIGLGDFDDNYAAGLRAIGRINCGQRQQGFEELTIIRSWILDRCELKSLIHLLPDIESILIRFGQLSPEDRGPCLREGGKGYGDGARTLLRAVRDGPGESREDSGAE